MSRLCRASLDSTRAQRQPDSKSRGRLRFGKTRRTRNRSDEAQARYREIVKGEQLTCRVCVPNHHVSKLKYNRIENNSDHEVHNGRYRGRHLQNRWSCPRGRCWSRSGHRPSWARWVATDRTSNRLNKSQGEKRAEGRERRKTSQSSN